MRNPKMGPRYPIRLIGLALCAFWRQSANKSERSLLPVVLEWVSSDYDPNPPDVITTPSLLENLTVLSFLGYIFDIIGVLGLFRLWIPLFMLHTCVKVTLVSLAEIVFPAHLKWKSSAPSLETAYTGCVMLSRTGGCW